MKLIKCYVENFGILSEKSYSFDKGLNCILSDNGSGKSTLAAFIKAMLYGIGDTRKSALSENERKRYSPWQKGRYGGSLTIEYRGKEYTIERSFGDKVSDDTFKVIECESGKATSLFSENIGEEIFEIDRDGFERTVFLSERNLRGKNENKSISGKLSDLVGTDGDIGEYDNAIKLLDQRRKFYFKKGGSGEIGELKASLARLKNEAERIEGARREILQKEEEIKATERSIAQLDAERISLNKELLKSDENRAKAMARKRLNEIKNEAEQTQSELDNLNLFFKSDVPTQGEIDAQRDKYLKINDILGQSPNLADDKEYNELKEFLGDDVNYATIARIDEQIRILRSEQNQLMLIKEQRDNYSLQIKELTSNTQDNDNKNKSSAKVGAVGIIISLILIIFGIALMRIDPLLCLISVAGVILLVYNLIRKSKAAAKNNAPSQEQTRCSELKLLRDAEEEKLTRSISEKDEKISTFLAKFPFTSYGEYEEKTQLLKTKCDRMTHLTIERNAIDQGLKKRSEELQALRESVEIFLRGFDLKSNSPFDEIRSALTQHSILCARLKKLNEEYDSYAKTNKLDENDSEPVAYDINTITDKINAISDEIENLRRTHALRKRECDELYALADRGDSVSSEIEKTEEKIQRYTHNLELIQKAQNFLSIACDNITKRYIGKTRESFCRYQKSISGKDGEFALDTEFVLSQSEKGESHSEEYYSKGTRDMYALAIRLSLIDSLYENELPFVILDDPFVNFDDGRLNNAKDMLRDLGKEKQIIYFTCSMARAI